MAERNCLSVVAHDLGGKSQGPLLLFLHANGFHGRAYTPMLPVLAPHFHCVALDLPGHGDAPSSCQPLTAKDLLSSLQQYVELRGIHGCYCFGHSLGGSMAALLQLERPQTFRGMFLYEPVIRPFKELVPPVRGPEASSLGCSATPAYPEAPTAETTTDPSADAGPTSRPRRPPVPPANGGEVGGGKTKSPLLVSVPLNPRSDNLLARIARKRQAVYPSLDAAKSSLGSKPPFNSFHPQALHAYLACGGLRPLGHPYSTKRVSDAAEVTATGATDPRVTTETGSTHALQVSLPCGVTSNSADSFPSGSSTLTLSCAPETEACIYEALEPPPWREWWKLTEVAGVHSRVDDTCVVSNHGPQRGWGDGPGDGKAGGCGECSSRGCERTGRRRCRLAIAVGKEVGLHMVLARWSAEVAELVPGAKLIRFSTLQHLGPMEDPAAVATAVLDFFLECGGDCVGGGWGEELQPIGRHSASTASSSLRSMI